MHVAHGPGQALPRRLQHCLFSRPDGEEVSLGADVNPLGRRADRLGDRGKVDQTDSLDVHAEGPARGERDRHDLAGMGHRCVQTCPRQYRPAVLSPAPATRPVHGNLGWRHVELSGGRYAQQDRAEQEAVAVSCQPVSLRTGPLAVVEQRQMRRAEILNPADVNIALGSDRALLLDDRLLTLIQSPQP